MTDTSDSAAKDALRERMRAVRSDLAPAVREAASRAIASRVAHTHGGRLSFRQGDELEGGGFCVSLSGRRWLPEPFPFADGRP